MMRVTTLVACLCLLSCATYLHLGDSYVLRESLEVDLSGVEARSLEILLRKGHVLVTSGDALDCSLYVDVTANSEVAARELASGLRLSPRVDSEGRLHLALEHDRIAALDSANAFYRLTVPPSMDLDIKTSEGDVTLRNYAGEVRVRTDSGRIRADMNSKRYCTLLNHSGNTELTGIYGEAEIRSQRGTIIADLPQMEKTGMVRLDLRSVSGSIILRAAEDDDLSMTFATDRGKIRSDLPLRWISIEAPGERQSYFKGGLGERSGAVEVRVDSESGILQILRR